MRVFVERSLAPAERKDVRWQSVWRPAGRTLDRLFIGVTAAAAAGVILLAGLIAVELWRGSAEARHAFGFGFVTSSSWDPVARGFGALPVLYGTVATSLLALMIAGPIGIGTAIFLAELCPRRLRLPVGFLVEMLAGIPSVVYGLWALFVLVPVVRGDVQPFLEERLGFLPLFSGPKYGVGLLAASLVLAIMILPTVAAIARDVLGATSSAQRDAAYALGATRWEVISSISLPAARVGIIGALILGLGRALGETMAVTMVIGNRAQIDFSLFALGDTMASVIANQFNEADYPLYTSALIEVGLILFIVTVILNLCARFLVRRLAGKNQGAGR
jgi:phosphate transport system permease protein